MVWLVKLISCPPLPISCLSDAPSMPGDAHLCLKWEAAKLDLAFKIARPAAMTRFVVDSSASFYLNGANDRFRAQFVAGTSFHRDIFLYNSPHPISSFFSVLHSIASFDCFLRIPVLLIRPQLNSPLALPSALSVPSRPSTAL